MNHEKSRSNTNIARIVFRTLYFMMYHGSRYQGINDIILVINFWIGIRFLHFQGGR